MGEEINNETIETIDKTIDDWATTSSMKAAWGLLAWMWQWMRLAYAGASAWLRVRLCTAQRRDDWAVYRVYAFEEPGPGAAEPVDPGAAEPGEGVHSTNLHKFHELPARFFSPETWEEDALDATGWERLRVEVRYRQGDGKFRMVLRPGDRCVFPPPRRARGFPLTVLAASLRGNDLDVDVTHRVLKYAGATRDFHGTRVTVRDMFPFDDHDDNAQRFKHLRVIDSLARVHTHSYLSDDSVAPPPFG
jgi:hypothetical protein